MEYLQQCYVAHLILFFVHYDAEDETILLHIVPTNFPIEFRCFAMILVGF